MIVKPCTRCGIEKTEDEFYAHPNGRHGLMPKCKQCHNAATRSYHHERGGREKARERALVQKYGITEDHYQQMLTDQEGVCAICHKGSVDQPLQVDHDHETGEVRGLLCITCNTVLGYFNDDVNCAKRMVQYLNI